MILLFEMLHLEEEEEILGVLVVEKKEPINQNGSSAFSY